MSKKTAETRRDQHGKKFTLLDQDGKIAATLIDRELAEKWISDRKKGAVKFTDGVLAPVRQVKQNTI